MENGSVERVEVTVREEAVPERERAAPEHDGVVRLPDRDSPRSGERIPVDADCGIEALEPLSRTLHERVIGQDHAVDALVCSYSRLLSGLHDANRPLFTGLLMGPTGVGKTETARAVAHALFGSDRALTRVNCEEYQHGHELSKLLGAPPGYVGQDVEPLLSQQRIEAPHRNARSAREAGEGGEAILADRLFGREPERFECVVLFDEIEKASHTLWNALLGILEDGTLTLGNNETTDFTRAIILMTSNAGSREMSELLEGPSIGFSRSRPSDGSVEVSSVEEVAREAARQVFPMEFLNRFDEILVYKPLSEEDLHGIFDKFLSDIHDRALRQAGVPLLIRVSDPARGWIVERGTDLRFGARPLRRAMERELVDPLSRLIAAGRVMAGDVVEVESEEEGLRFYRLPPEKGVVVS